MIQPNRTLLVIKEKLFSNKTIVANFGYLSILQILNLVFPILVLPYLINTLGKETYGLIVYSQAVIGYFVVLVAFGFNIIATREISLYRANMEKVNEIVSSVYTIKGILFLLSLIIVLVYSAFYGEDKLLFLLTMYLCLNEFLFPVWYFQGMEKMKYITILTLVSRLTCTLLIFILVKSSTDFLLVPVLNGIGVLISCIASLSILYSQGVRFKLQKIKVLYKYLKMSYIMALAYSTNIFKINFNIIVVKHLFSYSEVAYFDLALKVSNLGITFLDLISQAIFPKMSRDPNKEFLNKVIKISLFIAFVVVGGMQFAAPFIISILGNRSMLPAVSLLQVLIIILPFYIWGALLGRNCLLIHGLDNEILKSMAYSSIVYFLPIGLLYIIKADNFIFYICYVYVFSFFFESLYRYRVCKINRLI